MHHWFGGLHVIDGVSFSCQRGLIKAIIGPNGAGKSTLFNLVAGSFPPVSGRIAFDGREVTGLPSHRVASLGIVRTFQASRLFPGMSVLENVMAGRYARGRSGFLAGMLRLPSARHDERDARRRSLETLESLGLADLAGADARSLPFGRQRIVEIARAMVAEPRLLLLDEPACGLNIQETERLGGLIRDIRSRGVTVLVVEHDMSLVMDISDEVVVLDQGSLVAEGTPREVQADPRVVAIYLGDA
ncbi:MAG: high-affinity branched-chain amino acid ABC transporter ATP-binding protein LivG [Spirochaetes bacterium RBG_13_68_11]|nr:MAG: high-affinity branched-chain amino acid ABC transporter ATP-binding protein LivG [Spirochaetes bacterium RBG_13_68_11]